MLIRARILFIGLIFCCLGGGVALAGGRTIKLTATAKRCDINAGVSSKCSEALTSPSGKAAGSAQWDCTFNPPGSANETCTETFKIQGGKIVAQFKTKRGVLGTHNITSGTGAFARAHGTVSVKQSGRTYAVTIKLR